MLGLKQQEFRIGLAKIYIRQAGQPFLKRGPHET